MVLTVIIEDAQGTWYLRVHPDAHWDLQLQPIDRLRRTICQGMVARDGRACGGQPIGKFPEEILGQLKSVLAILCKETPDGHVGEKEVGT